MTRKAKYIVKDKISGLKMSYFKYFVNMAAFKKENNKEAIF